MNKLLFKIYQWRKIKIYIKLFKTKNNKNQNYNKI